MKNTVAPPARSGRFWQIAAITCLIVAIGLAFVVHQIHRRLPPGIMQDIRAAVAARDIKDPDLRLQKYFDLRYGTQTNPENQKKAFVDFFNTEHIKALQMMVRHAPDKIRQSSIDATARWIQNYRESLTPDQRAELGAELLTPQGQAQLKAATAQYNSQDVYYRGATAPVISQLLQTIATLPKSSS